jgi:heterodisulfide reductase subunit B
MKKYALFLGCNIPSRVKQYESSARAVLERVGVELVDSKWFTCCGYPLRNLDQKAFLLAAAQNMALSEHMGLDMLALCKCCFGTLKAARHILNQDEDIRREINQELAGMDLRYEGTKDVRHLLSVLYHDVGPDTLKGHVSKPLSGLKIGAHYGCHALRPSKVTQFDNPVEPSIFETLVEVSGAKSIQWDKKLDCCGAPLLGIDDELSMNLTKTKLERAVEAGVDYLCTACPYCQIQFDKVQNKMISDSKAQALPAILFPQLLGLSMGIGEEDLKLDMNEIEIGNMASLLSSEQQNGIQ